MRRFGAAAYGSANAVRLLEILGAPLALFAELKTGDKCKAGGFQFEAFTGRHKHVQGYGVGKLRPRLAPPLGARDYRMDYYFCYLIEGGGVRLLTDPGVKPVSLPEAEVLFVQPQRRRITIKKFWLR